MIINVDEMTNDIKLMMKTASLEPEKMESTWITIQMLGLIVDKLEEIKQVLIAMPGPPHPPH
jgi:hypothetical protein